LSQKRVVAAQQFSLNPPSHAPAAIVLTSGCLRRQQPFRPALLIAQIVLILCAALMRPTESASVAFDRFQEVD
jgi:hypothetical protein